MMKAKWTYGVACCCWRWWWWAERLLLMMSWTAAVEDDDDKLNGCWWKGPTARCRLLLLKMGKKGDRCRRAAVNEDCRGSPKPWAVEEIVVGSSLLKSRWTEKEATTMSTEERKGVKTGVTGPWALSLTAFVEDGDRCRCFCGCRLGICLIGKSILCVVICEDWRQ